MPEAESDPVEDDLDRIVAALNKHRVDFLIVGGYAVMFHGLVRATKDLDILIRPTPENARRASAALEEIGFSCEDFSHDQFVVGKGITFGEPPLRVDVLSQIRGIDFDKAWERRQTSVFGPNEANYIGLDDLIVNKEAVGRPQDLVDAQMLRTARDKQSGP